MLQFNISADAKHALVQYPKEARIPDKVVPVFNAEQIERKWRMETRRYIYETLRKWLMQRQRAYAAKQELTAQRNNAIETLKAMLFNYEFGSLHSMCRKIVDNYELFVSLLPSKQSRNWAYAQQVIAPILLWCREYRDAVNNQNQLVNK